MACRTYNPGVRIGNWNEDLQLEEDQTKDFIGRKARGELHIQRSQNLRDSILNKKEVSISRDGNVHFGDVVMLMNKGDEKEPRDDAVLSLHIDAMAMHTQDEMSSSIEVSGSCNCSPCTRNIFVVTSKDGAPTGECLTYGQPFYLCAVGEKGERMYLHSDKASFNKASKKARHNAVTFVNEPSALTEFIVLHYNPQFRLESEHSPVPSNAKIVLTHAKTYRNLALEKDFKLRTPFGWEYEISCHNHINFASKAEKDVNHFMFIMGVAGDTTYPVPPQQ
ncbi:cilia- and flagella-associated protein 161-like [Lineus longissimus]|uniref:cilia- and flagella-associated protein 161-like n=1 Tax=Lineus longissimus TaxID=88925 RepID=UPI002B4EE5A2